MMDRKRTLIREVEDLPTGFLQEVLYFVQFLKVKATQEHLETALLSECALRKDWLKSEEDEVWRSL